MWLKAKDKTGAFVRFSTNTIARYRPNIVRDPNTAEPVQAGTLVIFGNGDDNVLLLECAKLDAIIKPREVQ